MGVVGLFGVLGWLGGDSDRPVPNALGPMLGLVVGLPFSVLVHELGHALGAIAVRMRLTRLVFGNGPLLRAVVIGGIKVEVRRFQGIGLTAAGTIDQARYRSQWTVFSLAGPMISLLAAVLSFWPAGHDFLGRILFTSGLLHALMVAVTLRPGRGFGGTVSSDVADLREILAMSPQEIEGDIAYTASVWIGEFIDSGRRANAREVAERFIDDHPASEDRAWFEQQLRLIDEEGAGT